MAGSGFMCISLQYSSGQSSVVAPPSSSVIIQQPVARVVGAENIRETTLFPRDPHRLAP